MSDELGAAPLRFKIRNPQDFVAGIVLVGIAGGALYLLKDLGAWTGFRFTPATMPRLLALLLGGLGAAIAVLGLVRDGPAMPVYSFRGMLVVGAALVLFALTIETAGLLLSCFELFLFASFASSQVRWIEAVIGAVVMAALCGLLFVVALGLPFRLWPNL